MADETATTAEATPETEATLAKDRGIRILKGYGVLYLVIVIAYLIHAFTGSQEVAVSELQGGERFWNTFTFMTSDNKRVEFDKGDALPPEMVDVVQKHGVANPEARVELYKDDAFHNLPWYGILGVLNFLGLAILLYTVAGDMLPKMLADYGERLKEELSTARAAKEEAERLHHKREAIEDELKKERELLEGKIKEEAAFEYEQFIKRAKENIERQREALERHVEVEMQQELESIRNRVIHEAVAKVREELKDGVDEKTHEALVADFIIEMKGQNLK